MQTDCKLDIFRCGKW